MTLLIVSLFLLGFFFTLAGVIGVLRLPDFYSRLHAVSKSDTLGVSLMLLAVALTQGVTLDALKIFVILFFVFIANPTAAHAIGRAAYRSGLKPLVTDKEGRNEK